MGMSEEVEGLLATAIETYKTLFNGSVPTIAVCSPTKANIIGEHIAYVDGMVLSLSIPLYIIAVGARNDLNTIRIHTDNKEIEESQRYIEFPIPSIEPLAQGGPSWSNYVKGTIELFKGYILEGFDMVIVSRIPLKVGLGSSSAFCIAVYSFLEAFTKEVTVNLRDKAYRCMRAEEKFNPDKKTSGIMDIYILLCSKENYAISLDCRDMRYKYIPFNVKDVSVLIINSNKQSMFTDKDMESRKQLCHDAAKIMGLTSIREAKTAHFKAFKTPLLEDKERDMRARHAHSEIKRVERAVQAMLANDFKLLGRLMNQSQTSLKYDCEVTIPEIDELIDIVLEINGVYGTKMFGPGLGGCIIVLLKSSAVDEVVVATKRKFSGKAEFYLAEPAERVHDISYMIFNLERRALTIIGSISTQLEYAVEFFLARYNRYPDTAVQAPGRVTILGEHTCTHSGFMLQMAIPLSTIIVGKRNCTNFLNIYVDEDFAGGGGGDFLCVTLPVVVDFRKSKSHWTNMIYGTLLKFQGELKEGFDLVLVSTIPDASGLGRDSSVIVAFYTFLEAVTKQQTPKWTMKARQCYLAEHEYTENECSYADYLTIIAAEEDYLTYIDCMTEEIEMIPFKKEEYLFLLTTLPEEKIMPDDKYPDRQTECEELVIVLGIQSLREANVEMLDEKQDCMSFGMYKRGNYVIQEMMRTYEAMKSLNRKDYDSLGAIMLQSHNSLRYHYEHVSASLNQIVALTMKCPGVLGTKITSSEQSRCTLTLVRKKCLESVIDRVYCGYKQRTLFYTLEPKDGTRNITESLNLELRRRREDIDIVSEHLSVHSVASSDLNALSWSMFDLGEEWADWSAQRKKQPKEGSEHDSVQETAKDEEMEFGMTTGGFGMDDEDDI
ncbi:uncharacterized protein LOC106670813 [Cimex lectularius]|uniref:Galactokinase n=1 Tax=Cimex lectularius TaxID=79782 RepID=A0A8I6S2P0_CIMLE|nr:uncharacterized protein LOC106670813 [Cimex lectularius]